MLAQQYSFAEICHRKQLRWDLRELELTDCRLEPPGSPSVGGGGGRRLDSAAGQRAIVQAAVAAAKRAAEGVAPRAEVAIAGAAEQRAFKRAVSAAAARAAERH